MPKIHSSFNCGVNNQSHIQKVHIKSHWKIAHKVTFSQLNHQKTVKNLQSMHRHIHTQEFLFISPSFGCKENIHKLIIWFRVIHSFVATSVESFSMRETCVNIQRIDEIFLLITTSGFSMCGQSLRFISSWVFSSGFRCEKHDVLWWILSGLTMKLHPNMKQTIVNSLQHWKWFLHYAGMYSI